tara:strand:+ start:185 stop:370 length:186 start_codon:yes stop_codon:yes gene_type:complete
MTKNVREKSLKIGVFNLMTKHIPEFYESIVEASNRGELWGTEIFSNDITQLEIDFDLSLTT